MHLSKSFIRDEEAYQALRESYENLPNIAGYTRNLPHTAWYLGQPTSYPCVCVLSFIQDNNGPDYYEGDYIYLEDFN